MIWAFENSQWVKKVEYVDVVATKITQEILLWQTENPMSFLNGVNYKGVFNLEVLIRQQIQDILENYPEIEYSFIEQSLVKDNILTINIQLSINDTLVQKELSIKGVAI